MEKLPEDRPWCTKTTTTRHDNNHATCNNASKSWRSDVPIILPGWEHHTGGVPVETHSTPVPGTRGRLLWVAHSTCTQRNAQMSPTLPQKWKKEKKC